MVLSRAYLVTILKALYSSMIRARTMETEDYRGSLYVKAYHVILLKTSDSLGDQLSPYATESKKCYKFTNRL